MNGKKNIKVAICIPAFNKAKLLKRLLDSIISQTYSNYVVCIADDSQNGEVEQLCATIKDSRFHYYKNGMQLGATANNNQAIRYGQLYSPDYIKIMHHDDFFTYDYSLEKYVKLMDDSLDAEWIFSSFYMDYGNRREVGYPSLSRLEMDKTLLADGINVVGAPSVTMVRNNGIMMDEALTWLVDVDWYLKLLQHNRKYLYVDEFLVSVGIDEMRLSDNCIQNRQLCVAEHIYLHKKYHLDIKDRHSKILVNKCIWGIKGTDYERDWYPDDYYAIIRDALRDGKKICVWGAGKLGVTKACQKLMQKGLVIDIFCDSDESKWNMIIRNDILCISPDALLRKGNLYLCFVALANQEVCREIEKYLTDNHIRCLPFIDSYLEGFEI